MLVSRREFTRDFSRSPISQQKKVKRLSKKISIKKAKENVKVKCNGLFFALYMNYLFKKYKTHSISFYYVIKSMLSKYFHMFTLNCYVWFSSLFFLFLSFSLCFTVFCNSVIYFIFISFSVVLSKIKYFALIQSSSKLILLYHYYCYRFHFTDLNNDFSIYFVCPFYCLYIQQSPLYVFAPFMIHSVCELLFVRFAVKTITKKGFILANHLVIMQYSFFAKLQSNFGKFKYFSS